MARFLAKRLRLHADPNLSLVHDSPCFDPSTRPPEIPQHEVIELPETEADVGLLPRIIPRGTAHFPICRASVGRLLLGGDVSGPLSILPVPRR